MNATAPLAGIKDSPLPGHRTALILLLLAYTLSITDRMILSVLFTPIKMEFGLTDTQLGLLGGLSFAIFYATLGIPIAKLADTGNRKFIIVASLLIFSVMTMLCGLATGLITLLLFRIGVGVGEAGVNPASQSIVADYYPESRRSSAMAILMLGANFGVIFGFIVGGAISEEYGWRAALVAVGAPGVLLTIFMALFLKEPVRGSFARETSDRAQPSIVETAKAIWRDAGKRNLTIALSLTAMLQYGQGQWMPSYLMRTHDIAETEAGAIMGLVFGLTGILGAITGGRLSDRAAERHGVHGIPRLLSISLAVAIPLLVIAFQIPELRTSLFFFFVPIFLMSFYLGPSLGLVQTLSPVKSRAVNAALVLLCINLIGLGFGPLLVGIFSDALEPTFPGNGLRYAISGFSIFGLWAAFHYARCSRNLAKHERDNLNGTD